MERKMYFLYSRKCLLSHGHLPKIPELVCYSDGHYYLTLTILLQELIINAAVCVSFSPRLDITNILQVVFLPIFFRRIQTQTENTKSCK